MAKTLKAQLETFIKKFSPKVASDARAFGDQVDLGKAAA